MGIQERLRKARYSEQSIYMPNRDELLDSGLMINDKLINDRLNFHIAKVRSRCMDILYNPPIKDRYYKYNHSKLVNDYKECNFRSNGFISTLTMPRLSYYILNSHRYGDTFEYYGVSWAVSNMFEMRKSVMERWKKEGKIPNNIYDVSTPASHQFYPLYKPMTNRCMLAIAYKLYDILIPISLQLIRDSGLATKHRHI